MRLSTLPLLAVVAACAATSSQNSATDVAAVGPAIDSLDLAFQRWMVQEKVDSILSYYTSDAIVMNPNQPVAKGSDAIRASLSEMFKQASLRLTIKRDNLVVGDSIASDQGHYTIEIRAKPDSTKMLLADHGNYVTTFVRRNGQWRAIYDIATSELPMPMPPAAPAVKADTKK